MELSIVIPTLNEEKTITVCVEKGLRALKDLNIKGEVLVVDNGSTDDSVKAAENAGARVIHVATKGYGSAYLCGFHAAKGEFIIMGDADNTYNFEEIATFVNKLKEGYDFVMGNRFKGRIEKRSLPFLHRYLGTPVLTWIMNLFFKTGIGDTNCGMRALTRKAFRKMHLQTLGMEFATEMVVKASLRKLKIAEVPCNLYKDKRDRQPKLNTWHDGWRHLRFMLLFTPSWTFLVPGITLVAIGLGGMALLSLRDIFAPGMLSFLPQKHMLSLMLLFLSGFQIVSLGLAAQAISFSKYFDSKNKIMRFLSKHGKLERGILCGAFFIFFSNLSFAY